MQPVSKEEEQRTHLVGVGGGLYQTVLEMLARPLVSLFSTTTIMSTHTPRCPASPAERCFHKERVLCMRIVHVEAKKSQESLKLAQILHLCFIGNVIGVRGQRCTEGLPLVTPQDKPEPPLT